MKLLKTALFFATLVGSKATLQEIRMAQFVRDQQKRRPLEFGMDHAKFTKSMKDAKVEKEARLLLAKDQEDWELLKSFGQGTAEPHQLRRLAEIDGDAIKFFSNMHDHMGPETDMRRLGGTQDEGEEEKRMWFGGDTASKPPKSITAPSEEERLMKAIRDFLKTKNHHHDHKEDHLNHHHDHKEDHLEDQLNVALHNNAAPDTVKMIFKNSNPKREASEDDLNVALHFNAEPETVKILLRSNLNLEVSENLLNVALHNNAKPSTMAMLFERHKNLEASVEEDDIDPSLLIYRRLASKLALLKSDAERMRKHGEHVIESDAERIPRKKRLRQHKQKHSASKVNHGNYEPSPAMIMPWKKPSALKPNGMPASDIDLTALMAMNGAAKGFDQGVLSADKNVE